MPLSLYINDIARNAHRPTQANTGLEKAKYFGTNRMLQVYNNSSHLSIYCLMFTRHKFEISDACVYVLTGLYFYPMWND